MVERWSLGPTLGNEYGKTLPLPITIIKTKRQIAQIRTDVLTEWKVYLLKLRINLVCFVDIFTELLIRNLLY